MSGTPLLIGAITVGATLITLYALESRGSITVNNKAIGGLLFVGSLFVGYRIYNLLQTFL